ncbi:MAG: thiol reductant ABC exporter subunit CydC [Lentisphaerae bacterium]|nr:thiol reductant ABC exporter subunit CydC [Lentisphaerota bacterium]
MKGRHETDPKPEVRTSETDGLSGSSGSRISNSFRASGFRFLASSRPLVRALALAAPEWRWMLGGAVLALLTVGVGVALTMTSAFLIATAALRPSIADLRIAVAGVRFFGTSRGVLRYLERLVTHEATFRILARLRTWFCGRLIPLAPARLHAERSGDLLNRVVADVESLEHVYLRLLAPPFVALSAAVFAGAFFGRHDPRMAFAILTGLAIAGAAVPAATRALGRATGLAILGVRSEYQALAIDGVQGLADLVAFGRAAGHRARLDALASDWARLQRRMSTLTGLHEALTGLCAGATVMAILGLGAPMVADGRLGGVTLAVLALGTLAVFEAVAPLPPSFQFLDQAAGAADRLFALADRPPAVAPLSPDARRAAPAPGAIEFDGVTFSHDPADGPVLRGLDLRIEAGARVAIVGPSGAGKTTLSHLLVRFLDPDAGAVRIGGVDLRTLDTDALVGTVTVAPQHPWLCNGTVRDQMRLAREDAGDEALRACARAAGALEWIESLPSGWDTRLGEQGLLLSGGQRRRLALAQALLRDTPVYVFDEPTADLDPESAGRVMEALWSLAGRTVLVITHRLTGLDRADEVAVLSGGRIVERGRHADLLARGGLYRTLHALQRQAETLGTPEA